MLKKIGDANKQAKGTLVPMLLLIIFIGFPMLKAEYKEFKCNKLGLDMMSCDYVLRGSKYQSDEEISNELYKRELYKSAQKIDRGY